MWNKKRRVMRVFLLMSIITLLGACGKKEAETKVSEVSKAEVVEVEKIEDKKEEPVEEVKEEPKKEEVRSLITGEVMKEELKGKRPYAFMFNNIKFAYPQTESSKAGILYEILAEGGITRLMGIFDEMSGDKIGSVRSARHYYVDFAKEFDAYFIHFGQTKYAIEEMKKLNMDTLSGLSSESSMVFYRDNSIKPPHNAFATAKGIEKAIKSKKYRTELKEGIASHFNFSYEEEVKLEKDAFEATHVTVPFSGYMTPYFTYKDGKYTRYAFGVKHIDKGNNKALTFKNIFIQFVNEYNIDKNGYQTMDLIGFSGEAYYITNGKGIKVYWKKPDAEAKTKFYYDKEHKEEVLVNVGKTYYAVLPTTVKEKVTLKK